MQIGKKLVVVATVLSTGVAAALFFRKDASPDNSWQVGPVESPFRRRVESRVEADGAWARSTADGARLVPSATTAAIEQPLGPGEVQPSFQRSLNPVGALLEPVQGVAEEPPAGAAPNTATDGFGGPLVHRISDGDTLSRLAERYLGRSERYLEIYNANRDVLTSPDLLPIGATLRIPQRNGQPSAVHPAGGTIPGNPVPGGLVPVTRQPISQSS
jgi:phage tail protein X